jgi:hypothetical protein
MILSHEIGHAAPASQPPVLANCELHCIYGTKRIPVSLRLFLPLQ